ncbi:MAG: GntR family transcriptional regulator [Verrucomicrobiales bacterium]|nr:GntR family transcriptional regulator [Verrucomicrobiales bacterium]|tara:strand:- start:427 stop:822 length:396 start_codon:yes stop_codon:yes gene_type:complete
MRLRILTDSGVPIYFQIVSQVKSLIASGTLSAGEELPAIRSLAERLVVNPNTVARAYLELERAGCVVKRRGAGTYVAENSPILSRAQRLRRLNGVVDDLLAQGRQQGFDDDEILEAVKKRCGNGHVNGGKR